MIERKTGNIRIGIIAPLARGQEKAAVKRSVSSWLAGSRVHGNGYEWLSLQGLTFGGRPACLTLGFRGGLFQQASWSVRMTAADSEDEWPTSTAIEAEVAFVRQTLAEDMGIHVGQTEWGEVWSTFDPRSHTAANGLRYGSK